MARDDEPLLVLSTLGGGLTALDMATNEIKWSIEEGKLYYMVPFHRILELILL